MTEQQEVPKALQVKSIKVSQQLPKITKLDNSIISNSGNNIYGYGISEYQNSSTLQKSIQSVSIPKAQRFVYKDSGVNDSFLNLPSIFQSDKNHQKGAGFGYGEKMPSTNRYKVVPGPGQYFRQSSQSIIHTANLSPTFGSGREAYQKVYVPHMQVLDPEVTKNNPSPSHYQKLTEIGKDKSKFTIKGKIQQLPPYSYFTPAPNNYHLEKCEMATKPQRFNKITFGFGERDKTNRFLTPGPGSYIIPSKFDKYRGKINTSSSTKNL